MTTGRKHFKPEQIIHMLREAEIKLAGLSTTGTAGDQSACHACIGYATKSTGSHRKGGGILGGWLTLAPELAQSIETYT